VNPEGAVESRSGAVVALLLLPGALVVLLGFNAGGYFPGSTAIAAIVLTQVLLVRILQAERPFAGLGGAALPAILALAGYAAWTLASALWSHSPSRALIEFDRVWLYLLVLLLFASVGTGRARLRWLIRGLVLGATVVCTAGLLSRVAPDVWHTAPDVANQRLSYPVTYWNALGLLAALAIVLATHMTSSLEERPVVRALAAGVLPLLGATLFFTFSRGATAACAVGLVAYALVGRPRALIGGVLASAPASAVLVVFAYKANLLDTVDPTTRAAVSQGHGVALAAALCCVAAAGVRLTLARTLDARLAERGGARSPRGRNARRFALAASGALALVLLLAASVPARLAADWHRFASGAVPHGTHGDLRQRLTDPANNGRTDLWRVALDGFEASPAHGSGAGTFQVLWDRSRPRFIYTIDAHSLYLQAMAELGAPGVALLAIAIGWALLAMWRRARGRRRSVYGALLAVGLVWALHAGVDWDWEMPVVTLPFFAAAGLALGSARRDGDGGWTPTHNTRLTLALLLLGTLILPVLLIGSQRRLGDAEHALYAGDCATASGAALSSIGWLDVRPQLYEVLGFCDLQRGFPQLGVQAMRTAVSYDPSSWEGYYGLAVAQASAGVDPRASVRRALRLNPHEPLAREALTALSSGAATAWVTRAGALWASALRSSDLSIVPA
jgi:hypothetical protein